MARVGEIIDGKYEVLREIGCGGMSVVYLAKDKKIGTYWAVKELRKDKDDLSNQIAKKALTDEANLMKKLSHPALPRIIDIIDDHENFYVVMDYIEGESLDKLLKREGVQPQKKAVDWANQLCDVLEYLHTQSTPIIYRDMKPSNVILKPNGSLMLIDLGIAREYKKQSSEDTQCIGTREYAAPEQFGGKGQSDQRTDIYALGVTLHYIVTGKNPTEWPYELLPIRKLNSKLSKKLEKVITKCTEIDPANRYFSCSQLKQDLLDVDEYNDKKALFIVPIILATVLLSVLLVVLILIALQGQRDVDNALYLSTGVSSQVDNKNISEVNDSINSENALETSGNSSDVVVQQSPSYEAQTGTTQSSAVNTPVQNNASSVSTVTQPQQDEKLYIAFKGNNVISNNGTLTQLSADTVHNVGDTFTLKVKVVNQTPPCNSYVGKISYDPNVLRVVAPKGYYNEGQYASGDTWFKSVKVDNTNGLFDFFHFNVINDFEEVSNNGKYNYVAFIEIEFKVIAAGNTQIDVEDGFNSYFSGEQELTSNEESTISNTGPLIFFE